MTETEIDQSRQQRQDSIADALAPFVGMPIVTPEMLAAVIRTLRSDLLEALKGQAAPAATKQEPARLMKCAECAKALGLSVTTFNLLRKRPRFPEYRLGKGRGPRFDLAEVRAWMSQERNLQIEMSK